MISNKIRIFLILLLFILVIFYLFLNNQSIDTIPNERGLEGVVFLFMVILGSSFFLSKRSELKNLKNQYLKHSFVFLIGYIIVFFQSPIDITLGNLKISDLIYPTNNFIIIKSLFLAIIGIISFFLGYYVISYKETRFLSDNKINNKENNPVSVSFLEKTSILCLLIYFFTIDLNYFKGNLYGQSIGIIPNLAIIVFKSSYFALIIQILLNYKSSNEYTQKITISQYIKKVIGWKNILIIFTYFISVILSGDRGPIIFYSLFIFLGYLFLTKKKYSLLRILILLLISAYTITLLGDVRTEKTDSSNFLNKLNIAVNNQYGNKARDQSISPATYELAGSINTFYVVVERIPRDYDYFHGKFQIMRFFGSFPLLDQLLYSSFAQSEYDQSSSMFISFLIQGDNLSYGNGTSILAEFYLDFGFLGIIIGMLIVGMLLKYLEIVTFVKNNPSVLALVVSFTYYSNCVYMSRSGLSIGIANIVLTFLFIKYNQFLKKRH